MPEVVVVTGASAGLGRAIVRRFAREGAHIALLARGKKRLAEARAEVIKLGGRAIVIPLDVADASLVSDAAQRVERELGPVNIWINNAMTSVFAPVHETTPDEFKRVTEVTYLGYVYGTVAALELMRPRDAGVIVQVGSALARRSIPLQAAYCAAKHAILGFTASLRSELIHEGSGVRVVMVQMPAMNTPQFDWVRSRLEHRAQPVPPIFQPEVGAEAVYWAAHNECGRELMVGWPTVKALIGNKIAPNQLDEYLARQGYNGQQTDEPRDKSRRDNLWRPVAGDWAAHGRFDDRALNRSIEFWLRTHRRTLAWLAGGLTAGAVGLVAAARRLQR